MSNRRGLWAVSLVALVAIGIVFRRSPTEAVSILHRVYLPVIYKPQPALVGCQSISGASYNAIPVDTSEPPAALPDLDLTIRGWQQTDAPLTLVYYGGTSDPNAPQLYSLFTDNRVPVFTAAYQVYNWDYSTNSRGSLDTDWPVTLLGMQVAPGEEILQPKSGYQIYPPNYQTLVLWATTNEITLTYTRYPTIAYGFAIHIEGVCVEPSLLALYNQWNSAGRSQLPALTAGQPLGRANGTEIQVAIRDDGEFLDPRSQKDWWQGK